MKRTLEKLAQERKDREAAYTEKLAEIKAASQTLAELQKSLQTLSSTLKEISPSTKKLRRKSGDAAVSTALQELQQIMGKNLELTHKMTSSLIELAELKVVQDLTEVLREADVVIFAARHSHYLDLSPDEVVETAGGPMAIIDCFGILNDDKIKRYFELGCEVKGLGRGHVRRIKEKIRQEREMMLQPR